jgi:hypothetical protein
MRRDDEDPRRGDAVDERGEIFFSARVDPVKILEHEDQRASRGAAQRHREHGVEAAFSSLGAVHGGDRGITGIDGKQIPHERDVRVETTQPAHAVFDLGDDLRFAVELVDAKVLAKLIHDRQQRARVPERDAPALEPCRRLARRRESASGLE